MGTLPEFVVPQPQVDQQAPKLPEHEPRQVTFKARRRGTYTSAGLNEVRLFSRRLLESAWYRTSLRKRIREGKAPQVEVLLYHYAYGKPKETVELQTGENLSGLLTLALGGALVPGILERQQLLPGAPEPVLDVLAAPVEAPRRRPGRPKGRKDSGPRRSRT